MWGRVTDKVSKKMRRWCVLLSASLYQTKHAGVLYSIKPHRFPLFVNAVPKRYAKCRKRSWVICQNPG